MQLSLTDLRDGLVLVEFPDAAEDAANRAAVALARSIRDLEARGLRDAIPAARTLLVSFDPLCLSHRSIRRVLARARPGSGVPSAPSRTLEIEVAFDGPDLPEVAAAAGLSPDAFTREYARAEYRVAFLGFSPGFAYMTGLPPRLRVPRLASPRLRVPAGSVAIAGAYTGIYPSATPGGWRIVGRTAARVFDPRRSPAPLFEPGDRVRFFPGGASVPGERERADSPPHSGEALFRVVEPGLWTAVVGAPRWGMASWGVPPGGAMDPVSLALANEAAENPPDAPALEMAMEGPELEALAPCIAAVSGAEMPVACGGSPREHGQPFAVATGDRLTFGRTRKGMRTYLAVVGGLREPQDAGHTIRLQRGDPVHRGEPRGAGSHRAGHALAPGAAEPTVLRAVPGPHAAMFTDASLAAFFADEWRVSAQSDRRGLRLLGAPLEHAGPAEVEPVGAAPGSVQVPGGGLPIVLGPDGPVTGGYPRIATVIGADLYLLGRAAPGDALRFARANLEEALAAAGARREYD